jgi:hypothetical protein
VTRDDKGTVDSGVENQHIGYESLGFQLLAWNQSPVTLDDAFHVRWPPPATHGRNPSTAAVRRWPIREQ